MQSIEKSFEYGGPFTSFFAFETHWEKYISKIPSIERNENVKTFKERKIRKLKNREKFWSLSEIIKTRDKVSEMRKYDIKFKQVLREYSHDNITNNNAFIT